MLTAAIPTNEHQRLEDLHALGILDTPPEDRFDRIVELASRIFHVPIAYIALIDADRQWFKSQCGMTADATGRDTSFCSHTILQQDMLIIPDACEDDRFHDNPMVVGEPYIRFYAGHPLTGPRGTNVGTLCIADTNPRDPSTLQLELFGQLAQLAEHELNMVELIDAQHELLKTQETLQRELQEAAAFVRALIPEPFDRDGLQADWVFQSSSVLGGDIFGYHPLNEDAFAIYLVDIMGHGVGAALMASSVYTSLRRETLQSTDFADPASVIGALNRTFPAMQYGNRFLTAWYGVYDRRTCCLRYAGAGHPPAFLFSPDGECHLLESSMMMVGLDEGNDDVDSQEIQVSKGSRLVVYSDGAYEIRNSEGAMLMIDGLRSVLAQLQVDSDSSVAHIRDALVQYQGSEHFLDDLSVLQIRFD
jgi:sigma-B regulation protein RsbU (phosphoserine phosphatase)